MWSQDNEHIEQEKPEVEQETKDPRQEEVELLNSKIVILEEEIKKLKKDYSNELLAFVNKKSKEASEIIAKKEQEISEKYEKSFEEKINFKYFDPLKELVEVIAQFEMVFRGITNPEVAAYLAGFKMFLSQFESLLGSFSITSFSPSEGEEFDSDIMEVISTQPTTEEEKDGKVSAVFKKGYKLYGRVLKLSTVSVFKLEPAQ